MAGVVLALPNGLLASPEGASSDGVSGSWIKVQPNNVSSVAISGTALQTSTTGVLAPIPFTSQQINFTLPGGRKGMWIDTSRSFLSFRVRYQVSTAGASTSTTTTAFLNAGAMSWFDRQTSYNAEGVVLDDMTNLGQIYHYDSLFNHDIAMRDSVALTHGFKYEAGTGINDVQGHSIPAFTVSAANSIATGSNYFSYSVPLFNPVVGTLNKSSFFPLGHVPKLDLQLTTAAIAPVSISSTVALTAGAVAYTIDNLSINLWAVYLDGPSLQLLGSPREHYVHSKTYRVAVNQIPAGTSGQQSYLIGARGRSVRSMATRVSDSVISTAGSASGVYDSKLPLVSSINYLFNGRDRLPPNPINLSINPSEAFLRTLYAHEEYNPQEGRSSVSPAAFCRYWATGSAPAAGTEDQQIIDAGSSSATSNLASFSFSEDLRKFSNSKIMDGVNLSQSAAHFLELNIAKAPTNAQNLSFISCLDAIVSVDMETGMVSVMM
jgi:hypothetical protein